MSARDMTDKEFADMCAMVERWCRATSAKFAELAARCLAAQAGRKEGDLDGSCELFLDVIPDALRHASEVVHGINDFVVKRSGGQMQVIDVRQRVPSKPDAWP